MHASHWKCQISSHILPYLSAFVLTARQPFGSDRSNTASFPQSQTDSWLCDSCDQLRQQISHYHPFNQRAEFYELIYLVLTNCMQPG